MVNALAPAAGPLVDPTKIDLDLLTNQDESVLAAALRRVQRESRDAAQGLTVHHSQSHSSSHSSTVW